MSTGSARRAEVLASAHRNWPSPPVSATVWRRNRALRSPIRAPFRRVAGVTGDEVRPPRQHTGSAVQIGSPGSTMSACALGETDRECRSSRCYHPPGSSGPQGAADDDRQQHARQAADPGNHRMLGDLARHGDFDRLATCFHDDAIMNATWYQGPATVFVERARASFGRGNVSRIYSAQPRSTSRARAPWRKRG